VPRPKLAEAAAYGASDTQIRRLHSIPARLVGVGQSAEERDAMLVTANNGHRRLHVVELNRHRFRVIFCELVFVVPDLCHNRGSCRAWTERGKWCGFRRNDSTALLSA
jgi:hypothetical protein